MFGLLYSMVFAKLPADRPEALVQIYSHSRSEPDSFRPFSFGAWQTLSSRDDVFDGVLAQKVQVVGVDHLAKGGTPRRTGSALVSANYFKVLGTSLAHGRAFTEEETMPGAEAPVAIASYGLWKRAGLDPDLVGRSVRVNGRPFTIVGITPKGFMGANELLGAEIFLPEIPEPQGGPRNRPEDQPLVRFSARLATADANGSARSAPSPRNATIAASCSADARREASMASPARAEGP